MIVKTAVFCRHKCFGQQRRHGAEWNDRTIFAGNPVNNHSVSIVNRCGLQGLIISDRTEIRYFEPGKRIKKAKEKKREQQTDTKEKTDDVLLIKRFSAWSSLFPCWRLCSFFRCFRCHRLKWYWNSSWAFLRDCHGLRPRND